jgi:hypothetical protein
MKPISFSVRPLQKRAVGRPSVSSKFVNRTTPFRAPHEHTNTHGPSVPLRSRGITSPECHCNPTTVDVYAVTIGNSDVILNIPHHGRGGASSMHTRIRVHVPAIICPWIGGPEICAALSQKRRKVLISPVNLNKKPISAP